MKEKRLTQLNRIIFVLALAGVAIAAYVTQSFLRNAPIVCINTGCELVRKSPASYLFNVIPVPSIGFIGYSLLAIFAFLRTSSKNKLLIKLMLVVSTFGVFFVSWFTYTELFVIKGICTWCAISAVNMFIIFLLTLKSFLLETKK